MNALARRNSARRHEAFVHRDRMGTKRDPAVSLAEQESIFQSYFPHIKDKSYVSSVIRSRRVNRPLGRI